MAWEITLHLIPLLALADNYIWLMHDTSDALVVDPGDDAVVDRALHTLGVKLRAILLTHHHPDHVGGAAALSRRHGASVHAPVDKHIEAATHRVEEGDEVILPAPAVRLRVIAVPGHTRSHIAYAGNGLLFCGDTLFSMGCGRLFEGTPAQMLGSLDRLAALPDETRVCCGHEYTQANGRFALTVDPDNVALARRMDRVDALRAQQQPTVPVDLATERATNPFLRIDSPAIRAWARSQGVLADDRVARFAAVRAAKDRFQA